MEEKMEKAFAWDPVMRSSALKYDPCIVSNPEKTNCCEIICSDCTITLISDRFLGDEFSKSILGKKGAEKARYPLAIIADTVGCNLNCWFCYAYKFLSINEARNNKCKVVFLTPERLAEQFYCKLTKISNLKLVLEAIDKKSFLDEKDKSSAKKHLELKPPLWRIRISGGEPLYSNKENFSLQPNYENSIKFWTNFFKELDSKIRRLKDEKKLSIVNEDNFKQSPDDYKDVFPLVIARKDERLNVRFDTNGILFAKKEFTELFLNEIYKLHKNGNLRNIYIEIDYSIKGPTPIEFYWSQRKKLPVDSQKISFDFEFDEHPQLPGYFNLCEKLKNLYEEDENFKRCIGITVERGINHNPSYNVYVNLENSLDWNKFSEKTKIVFSVVDNPIDIFNWRNQSVKKYLIKRGANIKVYRKSSDGSKSEELSLDISNLKYDKNCYYVIFPEKNAWIFSGTKKKSFQNC